MPLSVKLQEKLSKVFEPSAHINDRFKGNDITIITNESGEAITLFIGKRTPDGAIKGERYVRTIKRDPLSGVIKSSHWDNKGKVSQDPYHKK
jgi:hypothetical protein